MTQRISQTMIDKLHEQGIETFEVTYPAEFTSGKIYIEYASGEERTFPMPEFEIELSTRIEDASIRTYTVIHRKTEKVMERIEIPQPTHVWMKAEAEG